MHAQAGLPPGSPSSPRKSTKLPLIENTKLRPIRLQSRRTSRIESSSLTDHFITACKEWTVTDTYPDHRSNPWPHFLNLFDRPIFNPVKLKDATYTARTRYSPPWHFFTQLSSLSSLSGFWIHTDQLLRIPIPDNLIDLEITLIPSGLSLANAKKLLARLRAIPKKKVSVLDSISAITSRSGLENNNAEDDNKEQEEDWNRELRYWLRAVGWLNGDSPPLDAFWDQDEDGDEDEDGLLGR